MRDRLLKSPQTLTAVAEAGTSIEAPSFSLLPPSLPAAEASYQLDTLSGLKSTQPEHQRMSLGQPISPPYPFLLPPLPRQGPPHLNPQMSDSTPLVL